MWGNISVSLFVDNCNLKIIFCFEDFEPESLIEADGFLVCNLNVKVDCILAWILPTSLYHNCSGKLDRFTVKLNEAKLGYNDHEFVV